MLLHSLFTNMFAEHTIEAFLQTGYMIPDHACNINLLMQAIIPFGGIQPILIGFANFEYTGHGSDTFIVGESVGIALPRLTSQLYHMMRSRARLISPSINQGALRRFLVNTPAIKWPYDEHAHTSPENI
jgi:hypothetical protein